MTPESRSAQCEREAREFYGMDPKLVAAGSRINAYTAGWKRADETSDAVPREVIEALIEALNFYSCEVHYESLERMGGRRPPGVLSDRGNRAREAIKLYADHKKEKP